MCPSFNSFGSTPSVSQLNWDTDLVIPDGKAIESASGEVGITGESISGELITSTGANFENLTVNGYTPAVFTSSNASISIEEMGLNVIPITPSPITVSGNAVISTSATGSITVTLTAICYTPVGSSSVVLGSGSVSDGRKTITLNAKIPANTFMVKVSYSATGRASVNSVNITSTNYTSKALI